MNNELLPPKQYVFVFAGDYKQFQSYVQDQTQFPIVGQTIEVHGLNVSCGNVIYLYINSSSKVYGYNYRNCHIVKIGDWHKHNWMHDVIEDLEHRIAIVGRRYGK